MQDNWQTLYEITQLYIAELKEYWLNETLFTLAWWVLLITSLSLLIVWFIIADKKRIFELITYGFFVSIIASISDRMGILFGLWQYKHTLIPLSNVIEIHIVQMPIIYMLIYQYFTKWKSFLIATTITAFVFAFILEPLVEWLGTYVLLKWKYIYSFIPYILIAVLCKFVVEKIKQKWNHNST